jgi:Ca-activated chloride channel family protein
MNNIEFANKNYLWLFLLLIPIIAWYIWRLKKSVAAMSISTLSAFSTNGNSLRYHLRHILFILKISALSLLIIALARPQRTDRWETRKIEGVDIVIALDISGSMLAEDFKPNRIEASKQIAMEFINGRPNDRIGLVVFSGEAFTQSPLTIDHAVLMNLFSQVKSGMIEDGTAIGLGLATAVNRLKESNAVSKVIILLTDGVNNMGNISPIAAAEFAKEFGIRVYTIGVGKIGMAPYPFQTPFGIQYQNIEVKIDEDILKKISEMTGGKYFRATNNEKMREIYKEIDSMEKTQLEVKSFSKPVEEFKLFALIALLLLVVERLLGLTVLKNTF